MNNLDSTFKEVDKSLRMWITWKLKVGFNSGPESTWDRMSKHDQDFNLVWNEIMGDCKELSLPKLKKVMDFVRTI